MLYFISLSTTVVLDWTSYGLVLYGLEKGVVEDALPFQTTVPKTGVPTHPWAGESPGAGSHHGNRGEKLPPVGKREDPGEGQS